MKQVDINNMNNVNYSTNHNDNKDIIDNQDPNKKAEYKVLNRLILSVVLLVILLYISLGYQMFNFALPKYFKDSPVAISFLQMLLSIGISVIKLQPTTDIIIILLSAFSFIYSFVIMTNMVIKQDMEWGNANLSSLYFNVVGILLVLFTVSDYLEVKIVNKINDDINDILILNVK